MEYGVGAHVVAAAHDDHVVVVQRSFFEMDDRADAENVDGMLNNWNDDADHNLQGLADAMEAVLIVRPTPPKKKKKQQH